MTVVLQKEQVLVIFTTADGRVGGIVDNSLAGRTVAQIRAAVRNDGFSLAKDTFAFLGGRYIPGRRERRVFVSPGDELWFGWRPPN